MLKNYVCICEKLKILLVKSCEKSLEYFNIKWNEIKAEIWEEVEKNEL